MLILALGAAPSLRLFNGAVHFWTFPVTRWRGDLFAALASESWSARHQAISFLRRSVLSRFLLTTTTTSHCCCSSIAARSVATRLYVRLSDVYVLRLFVWSQHLFVWHGKDFRRVDEVSVPPQSNVRQSSRLSFGSGKKNIFPPPTSDGFPEGNQVLAPARSRTWICPI
jgi:hypothetical protein